MADNIIELLMNLFEKNLAKVQENGKSDDGSYSLIDDESSLTQNLYHLPMQSPTEGAIRVVSFDERIKLTKASYQFLMRMRLIGVIDMLQFEQIMDELQLSGSRIITLEEVKWVLKNLFATFSDEKQLAFLDFILYQTKDELTAH